MRVTGIEIDDTACGDGACRRNVSRQVISSLSEISLNGVVVAHSDGSRSVIWLSYLIGVYTGAVPVNEVIAGVIGGRYGYHIAAVAGGSAGWCSGAIALAADVKRICNDFEVSGEADVLAHVYRVSGVGDVAGESVYVAYVPCPLIEVVAVGRGGVDGDNGIMPVDSDAVCCSPIDWI